MFTNECHYYLMDMVPNICRMQFPGVSNYFHYLGIWQRSPKVMKEGKTVYLIYPGFLKMITVVMFTNAFHYFCMHIAPTACKIHFPGVPNYFDQIGIWQGSPKVIKVGKSVFSIHYWCLWMSSVVKFTIIFTYYLLDIDHNTWSIQFMGVSIFVYLKCIC